MNVTFLKFYFSEIEEILLIKFNKNKLNITFKKVNKYFDFFYSILA